MKAVCGAVLQVFKAMSQALRFLNVRRNPKGQNRMPKSGVRKEANKFCMFSWHSQFPFQPLCSQVFFSMCTAAYK